MRNIKIAPGEYYHNFNRGMSKQLIFHNNTDWTRFLFLILYFQSPLTFINIGRPVKQFVKHSVFNIDTRDSQGQIRRTHLFLFNAKSFSFNR